MVIVIVVIVCSGDMIVVIVCSGDSDSGDSVQW